MADLSVRARVGVTRLGRTSTLIKGDPSTVRSRIQAGVRRWAVIVTTSTVWCYVASDLSTGYPQAKTW